MKLVNLTFVLLASFGVTTGCIAARSAVGGGVRAAPAMNVHRAIPTHLRAAPVGAFRGVRRGFVVRPRARVPVFTPVVVAPYYALPAPYLTPYYTPVYTEPYVAPYGEPIYIEQTPSSIAPEQQSTGLSYYCASLNGYYPNVRSCPEGWRQAAPDPAVAFLNELRAQ